MREGPQHARSTPAKSRDLDTGTTLVGPQSRPAATPPPHRPALRVLPRVRSPPRRRERVWCRLLGCRARCAGGVARQERTGASLQVLRQCTRDSHASIGGAALSKARPMLCVGQRRPGAASTQGDEPSNGAKAGRAGKRDARPRHSAHACSKRSCALAQILREQSPHLSCRPRASARAPVPICGRPPACKRSAVVQRIACDHMSGLLSRSHMTAAKMVSATRGPNRVAVSDATGYRGVSRVLGSIDHTNCSVSSKLPAFPSIVLALQIEPESALLPNALPNRAAISAVTARFSLMMS